MKAKFRLQEELEWRDSEFTIEELGTNKITFSDKDGVWYSTKLCFNEEQVEVQDWYVEEVIDDLIKKINKHDYEECGVEQ